MLSSIWDFLKDGSNQAVLSWIGGGIVVVAGAFWATLKFFFPRDKNKRASPPSVHADRGGVAAGRDIRAVQADHGSFAAGRDIRDNKFGLDEKETGRRIAAAQEPLVAHLVALAGQVAREKGVATAPLVAVLAKLGYIGAPEHEIPARLDAAADSSSN